jgi:MFS family permease
MVSGWLQVWQFMRRSRSDAGGKDMETNDNKKSARSLYLLFGAWYAMGSAISTLLTVTLADKLTKEHFSGKMLGSLMAVTALPWVLKPIWGILIDRFKTMYWWAMAASVAASFSVLVVAKVEASLPYWLIVALVLIPNILRSLQDVAVDGLSVAVSREEQRGAIQKWMRIGTIIGTLLGGAGAMYFMEKNSWFTVCVTMMVISVIREDRAVAACNYTYP